MEVDGDRDTILLIVSGIVISLPALSTVGLSVDVSSLFVGAGEGVFPLS